MKKRKPSKQAGNLTKRESNKGDSKDFFLEQLREENKEAIAAIQDAIQKAKEKELADWRFNQMYEASKKIWYIQQGRKDGNTKGNKKRTSIAEKRRELIKSFLKENPNCNTGAYSLEGYLIKTLGLKDKNDKELSEKTIKNDLKKITLEKR